MSEKKYDTLWHQSGVNKDGKPFVQLLLGEAIIGQMSPEQARDHANAILQAAESAEQDAFFLDYLRSKIALDLQAAMRVIIDFRDHRQRTTGKSSGPTNPRDWVKP